MKLRTWVKVVIAGLVVLLLIVVHNIIVTERENREQELVTQYTTCLQENFTQRSYCAKQINQNYHYMDALIKEYGYSYKQVGQDLYLINSESVK